MYELEGKVALVTGAGGEHGIGRGIALRLAREGADVAVNDIRGEGSGKWGGLAAVVAEIEANGGRAIGCVGSVANAEDVERMVGQTIEAFGRIDILVNNAGSPAGPDRVPVVELDEDIWDLVLEVNAKGTFLCSRAVARHMIERGGGGRIINLSSSVGKRGKERYAAYCASKFAVIGFTQCLALELAPHSITVNAICPGLIDTERVYGIASGVKPTHMTTQAFHDQMLTQSAESTPLGRVGQPEDVAQFAAYLASGESAYMTGLAINVNGGALMS